MPPPTTRPTHPHAPLVGASRTADWAAMATGVLGIAGLIAWYTHTWNVLSLGRAYVPMAPLTSLTLLAVSYALHRRLHDPRDRWSAVLSAFAILACAGVLVSTVNGTTMPLERLLVPTPGIAGTLATGRMGLLTAGSLLLGGIAVLAPWLPFGGTKRYEQVVALVLVLLGAVFIQGYILGMPPMYGSTIIPPASVTSLALFCFGLALLFAGGRDGWPLRLFTRGTASHAVRLRARDYLGLAVLPATVVIISGLVWYDAERADSEHDAMLRLSTFVRVQGSELSEAFEQHLGTARALRLLPVMNDELEAVNGGSGSRGGPEASALVAWLAAIQRERGYLATALFLRDGRPLGSPSTEADSVIRDRVARALRERVVIMDDIHATTDGRMALTFWTPIGDTSRPAAVLMTQLDAQRRFLAMLDRAATGFPDADVWLVRREGELAVVLTPRRDNPRASLNLRIPLAAPTQASALMVRDGTRAGRGTDFSGAEVVFAGVPIANTSWWLAAAVPRATLGSPLAVLVARLILTLLVILALGAALLGTAWYRRDLASAEQALMLHHEREKSLEALQASEARLSRALAAGSDGIWEWDIANGRVFISENWRWLLGSDGSGNVPISVIRQLLHPDDAREATEGVLHALREGKPFSVESRVIMPGGEPRWIWVRGEATKCDAGAPIRATGSLSDIHARRTAEDQLRRTQRILRVSVACGKAVAASRSEAELLKAVCDLAVDVGGYRMAWVGYAEDDTYGSVSAVASSGTDDGYLANARISWRDVPRGRGPTGRCIRTGTVQAIQHFLTDPAIALWRHEARARGFESSCAIPLVIDDRCTGAITLYATEPDAFDAAEIELLGQLGRDLAIGITALRTRRERDAGQEQLALFRRVMDTSNDAVFISDADTRTFVDVNSRACSMLGYTRDELLRLGPADINEQVASAQRYDELVARARAHGDLVVPGTHHRKDGSLVSVETAVSVAEVGGRRLVLGVARDITDRLKADAEREALQAQLAQAQKMEVVGRLAGGVAHDFNNMLAVITGYTELMLAGLDATAPNYDDLCEIKSAADRSAALTRQLLAFARLQVMRPVVADPNDAIADMLKMLRRVLGEDIKLVWEPGADTWPVCIDPTQLDQLLANIAVNARDAIAGTGSLTVRTSNVRVAAPPQLFPDAKPGEYVRIALTDTGAGMGRDTLAHIFEPFFTTKEKGKGTGLGMSIVFGIASQNHGFVDIASEPGKGTTVAIHLPRSAAEPAAPTVAEAPAPRGDETVLVVEDESQVLGLARTMLERQGYRVLTASSPASALRVARDYSDTIHAVLTDVIMPDRNGKDLADALRALRPDIRVVYMSGHTRDVLSSNGRLAEGTMFLQKPFTISQLATKLREALDQPVLA